MQLPKTTASGTVLALFAGVVASGCATMPPGAVSAGKVILAPMPMRADDASLHALFAPKAPENSPRSRQAIADAIAAADAHALADMRADLETRLGASFDDGEAVSRLVDELRIRDPKVAVTEDMAGRLRAVSNADSLLRFRITDYGITPRSWLDAYIAFEVTSTLAIAAVAYAYPATRAIAGVYLVQETAEETAEGYAGFWAVNEVSRPVRIEAELDSLRTGRRIWKDSATGFSDIGLSRLVRKVGAGERDQQLKSSIDEAVGSLVDDMREALAERDARRRGESRRDLPAR